MLFSYILSSDILFFGRLSGCMYVYFFFMFSLFVWVVWDLYLRSAEKRGNRWWALWQVLTDSVWFVVSIALLAFSPSLLYILPFILISQLPHPLSLSLSLPPFSPLSDWTMHNGVTRPTLLSPIWSIHHPITIEVIPRNVVYNNEKSKRKWK